MFQRGSFSWWAIYGCIFVFASLHWSKSMRYFTDLHQTNLVRSKYFQNQADHFNRTAIALGLQAILDKNRAIALQKESEKCLNKSHEEEIAYHDEIELAEEYETLYKREEEATKICKADILLDEATEKRSQEHMHKYMAEIDRLKNEYHEFCIIHQWVPMWFCDAMARWKGVDEEEKQLALLEYKESALANKTMIALEKDKRLESSHEKNASHWQLLAINATDEAILLEEAYESDEARGEALKSKSSELFEKSTHFRDEAVQQDAMAKTSAQKARSFNEISHYQLVKARGYALLAAAAALVVFVTFVKHLLALMAYRRTHFDKVDNVPQESYGDDDDTVESIEHSETSPLVAEEASLSSGSSSSYYTIEFGRSTTSSVTLSSALSNMMRNTIQRVLNFVRRDSFQLEIAGVMLVLVVVSHVLVCNILRNVPNILH